MHYNYLEGAKRKGSKIRLIFLIFCIAVIAAGLYILYLSLIAPRIMSSSPRLSQQALASQPPKVGENKLYIPEIGLSVDIKSGGEEVLNDSVWHRYPERGDPIKGGNFILAGHRWEIGLTPGETRRKSPFYNINRLKTGNDILVDFSGQRYTYKVTKIYTVKPSDVQIEDPNPDDPHMTLYTCTLQGQADGRVVVIAKNTDESAAAGVTDLIE